VRDLDLSNGFFTIAILVNGIVMYIDDLHQLPLPLTGGRKFHEVPERDIWGNALNFGNKLSSLDFRFVAPGTTKPKPKPPRPRDPIEEFEGLPLRNRRPKRQLVRYLGIVAGLAATVAVWRQFTSKRESTSARFGAGREGAP
jgi:hypothetical protein